MSAYSNDEVRAAISAIGRVALGSDENGPLPQDIARAVLDAAAPGIAARAWAEGHAAGRDYQGDGWNSDVHDPERDNPYNQAATA